jgi:protein-tyrosine phosphatase
VIDVHSHVLHALDDGPETLAGALAIARAMADDGVERVVATPHVRDDWPDVTPASRDARLEELRAALAAEGIPLEVLPGGEIALDALPALGADERRAFGLGGNPSVLLLEFPYWGWPLDLAATVFELRLDGVTPVLAHPERSADVQESPQRLEPVVRAGALVQLTAASVDGRLGGASRQAARTLLDLQLAHVVASDAHTAAIREAGLAAAREEIGEPLAAWLTEDVPRALIEGSQLPDRPGERRLGARSGRWWSRRGR